LQAAAARAMLRGVKSLTAPMLRAPADRPAWHRGIRAPLAFLAVIGAFWAALNFRTTSDRIYAWNAPDIQYSLDGPGWVHWAFVLALPTLLLAAGLLWIARRPAIVALGLLLFAGGLASVIGAVVARHDSGRVERTELDAVRLGASRSVVDGRLGWAAGHGTARVDGQRLDCLVYVNTSARWYRGQHLGLCFRDGRVVYRRFG
jgi:hypothetical protein